MTSFAIILVVTSAILHALRNFFIKKAEDTQTFVFLSLPVSLLVYLPFFLVDLSNSHTIWTNSILLIIFLSGLTHFCYTFFLAKAYEHGDLSHVYPITRSSPAIVLVIAVLFLEEKVSWLGLSGILAVAIGVYIINLKKLSLAELTSPFKSLTKYRSTRFAFLTLFSIAAYSIVDKIGVDLVPTFILQYVMVMIVSILFTGYFFKTKNLSSAQKEWNQNKFFIIGNGIFTIASYQLILTALTMANVTYVTGLRQLSIVFAVSLGSFALKEKYKKIRFFASLLILLGAFLISIA